jgi:tetratricopeptide (TPR) repeat protein
MRRLLVIALLTPLSVGLGACHKNKGKTTTPGGGSGSGGGSNADGMKDGETPDGDGGGLTGLPDSGPGTGDELPDGTGGGDGSGDGDVAKEDEVPHVAPPNLDPDPQEASSGVKTHLTAARAALKGAKPDADLAIKEAKEALAIDGTSIDAVVVLAHAYYHKKLYDTAETILDMLFKEREASHDNAGVFYVYGLIYQKTDKPEAAQKAFETAVKLKPNYGSALVNVGFYQLRNKQYDAAIGTFETLINDLGYSDAASYNSLGSAYRGRSGDYDPGSAPQADWLLKAETAFKKALQADKDYGLAYYNLGLLYLDADPFPTGDGGAMDTLVRLKKAQTYFDEYKNRPGVDMALYDERLKNVTKLIKREEKKRKKKGSDD